MKKIILLPLMAILVMSNACAQEYVDCNFTITKNISVFSINEQPFRLDEKTHKATLRIYNFGDQGNTVVLTLNLPSVLEADPSIDKLEYTWSGKNLHVVKKKEKGCDVYAIVRISRSPIMCASLMEAPLDNGSKIWASMIPAQDENTRCVSDIHSGMTFNGKDVPLRQV